MDNRIPLAERVPLASKSHLDRLQALPRVSLVQLDQGQYQKWLLKNETRGITLVLVIHQGHLQNFQVLSGGSLNLPHDCLELLEFLEKV